MGGRYVFLTRLEPQATDTCTVRQYSVVNIVIAIVRMCVAECRGGGKKEVVVLGKAPMMETWKGNSIYIKEYIYNFVYTPLYSYL